MNNTVELPIAVDRIIADFVDKICSIEPGFIRGVYLTGSLAMNDFYFNKSDIDFLVLCKELPGAKTATLLKQVHKTLEQRFPDPKLSGSYLAFDSIHTGKPAAIKALAYHEAAMNFRDLDMAAVSLTELRSNAITVYGMQAGNLPVDISTQCLEKFLYDNINSYWVKWIHNHSSFFNRKILLMLFPRFTEWSVLGVARQVCTLRTGKIVSKTAAGSYCLEHLPGKFHPVINEALETRKDKRNSFFTGSYLIRPSFKRPAQTIACVNYMIAVFNETYNEKRQLFLSAET